jgi:hypothetical protein
VYHFANETLRFYKIKHWRSPTELSPPPPSPHLPPAAPRRAAPGCTMAPVPADRSWRRLQRRSRLLLPHSSLHHPHRARPPYPRSHARPSRPRPPRFRRASLPTALPRGRHPSPSSAAPPPRHSGRLLALQVQPDTTLSLSPYQPYRYSPAPLISLSSCPFVLIKSPFYVDVEKEGSVISGIFL